MRLNATLGTTTRHMVDVTIPIQELEGGRTSWGGGGRPSFGKQFIMQCQTHTYWGPARRPPDTEVFETTWKAYSDVRAGGGCCQGKGRLAKKGGGGEAGRHGKPKPQK